MSDWVHIAKKIDMQAGKPLLLSGPLGCGKTVFARALIQDLFSKCLNIPSPSFPILIPYENADIRLWHIDLYRIEHRSELMHLGLEEIMERDYTIIEWPEKLDFYPNIYDNYEIRFSCKKNKRELWKKC